MTVQLQDLKMPPKGKSSSRKGGEGGAASGSDSSDKKAQGPKGGGNAIKVRHILCEKHGKIMQSMENGFNFQFNGFSTWENHAIPWKIHGKVEVWNEIQ